MSFMQKQITPKQTWIELDGTHGITALPSDVLSKDELAIAESVAGDGNADPEDLTTHFGEYYEGTVQSVTVRKGYGARLSAPGYLDCTEWTVFDTAEEAQQYLDETYDDDDDDDGSESDDEMERRTR